MVTWTTLRNLDLIPHPSGSCRFPNKDGRQRRRYGTAVTKPARCLAAVDAVDKPRGQRCHPAADKIAMECAGKMMWFIAISGTTLLDFLCVVVNLYWPCLDRHHQILRRRDSRPSCRGNGSPGSSALDRTPRESPGELLGGTGPIICGEPAKPNRRRSPGCALSARDPSNTVVSGPLAHAV